MSEESQQSADKKAKKPKSIVITLSEPIDWGEDTYEEIEIPRLKGKHLKTLPANPTMKDLVAIAQKACGLPNRIFDELDGADYIAVGEAVGDFLDNGQESGRKLKF